jgi:predicted nucleic acid-binding protein
VIAYVDSSVLLRVVLFQPDVERMDRVDVSPAVLRRAADPFPTPLGTLDAIHLATAVLWREGRSVAPVLVTHDAQLATAARAMGFATAGA